MENNKKEIAYQFSTYVFIILAVLTVGEFAIAYVGVPWSSVLIFIAVLKAFFVVQYYMHISRVIQPEEKS